MSFKIFIVHVVQFILTFFLYFWPSNIQNMQTNIMIWLGTSLANSQCETGLTGDNLNNLLKSSPYSYLPPWFATISSYGVKNCYTEASRHSAYVITCYRNKRPLQLYKTNMFCTQTFIWNKNSFDYFETSKWNMHKDDKYYTFESADLRPPPLNKKRAS